MSATNHHTTSGEFFPSLDGIRGIAVLSVVIYHTVYFNPNHTLQMFIYSFTKAGFMGVPIFFVLSGFLISFTVIRTQEKFSINKYIARRAAKIIPPFVLSLIIFSLLASYWKGSENILQSALAHFFTIANFTSGWVEINPVYWSLMVELHFYIIFPLLYFALKRVSKYPELWVAFLLLLIPMAMRITTHMPASTDPALWHHNANMFPKALDNFVLGILFAHILSRRSQYEWLIRRSGKLCMIGIAILMLAFVASATHSLSQSIADFTQPKPSPMIFELFRCLPAIGTFFLLFCIFLPSNFLVSRLLAFPPLQYMGLISYEWFLFHYPPVQFMGSIVGNADGNTFLYCAKTLFPFSIALAFSAMVYHFVSKPILDWSKSKLVKRKS